MGADGLPGSLGSDLRLGHPSPCVDAADNSLAASDAADRDGDGVTDEPTPVDIDGRRRFVNEPLVTDTGEGSGALIDMGAHERQVPPVRPRPTQPR